MSSYEALRGLESVYLEDSFVLSIAGSASDFAFVLDVVLLPRHAEWHRPKSGELHCYRRARLAFSDIRDLDYRPNTWRPAIDATGESDWGHIDVFTVDRERYHLDGDWGSLDLLGPPPVLTLG